MNKGDKAICALSIVPVRASHDDTSEIVTQLLFGELLKVIDIKNQWLKIKLQHDNYVGWIDHKQVLTIKEETYLALRETMERQTDFLKILKTPWGVIKTVQGAPLLSRKDTFFVEDYHFSWIDNINLEQERNIERIALQYLNAPYLWGGRTQFGIDCSGFTQTVFHQMGKNIPRDASQQVEIGEKIDFQEQKPGDLVFFKSEKTGNIHHVGIILQGQEVIHSHGCIRIDTLDQKGIFNKEKKYYSHLYHQIKRIKV